MSKTFDARDTFGRFPTGVVTIAARLHEGPVGIIAASFAVGVSQDPPMVSFAADKSSTTWPVLRAAPVVGISVMRQDQGEICMKIASKSNKASRFTGVDCEVHDSGAMTICGAPLAMEAKVVGEVPAGDHVMVLLEVVSARTTERGQPLVFFRSSFRGIQPEAISTSSRPARTAP